MSPLAAFNAGFSSLSSALRCGWRKRRRKQWCWGVGLIACLGATLSWSFASVPCNITTTVARPALQSSGVHNFPYHRPEVVLEQPVKKQPPKLKPAPKPKPKSIDGTQEGRGSSSAQTEGEPSAATAVEPVNCSAELALYRATGDWEAAVSLLDEVWEQHGSIAEGDHEIVLRTCQAAGQWEVALAVFEKMPQPSLEAHVIVFSTMCASGKVKQAMEKISELLPNFQLLGAVDLYGGIIQQLLGAGHKWEKLPLALEVYDEALHRLDCRPRVYRTFSELQVLDMLSVPRAFHECGVCMAVQSMGDNDVMYMFMAPQSSTGDEEEALDSGGAAAWSKSKSRSFKLPPVLEMLRRKRQVRVTADPLNAHGFYVNRVLAK